MLFGSASRRTRKKGHALSKLSFLYGFSSHADALFTRELVQSSIKFELEKAVFQISVLRDANFGSTAKRSG